MHTSQPRRTVHTKAKYRIEAKLAKFTNVIIRIRESANYR